MGISGGQLGTAGLTVTVYVHPARYTSEVLKESDIFTVSFYPETSRKALGYVGSHSGRNENKIETVGFTPVKMGQGVTFGEAELTFLCKKLYQHQFSREDLAPEIQAYYAAKPEVYPDFKGGWQPHYVFVGEIIDVRKKEENHVE
ncbi:MAG: flavin reductase [Blautia faecis]